MTTQLTRDDARAIARVLYAVHQRRATREAEEHPVQHRDDTQVGDANARA